MKKLLALTAIALSGGLMADEFTIEAGISGYTPSIPHSIEGYDLKPISDSGKHFMLDADIFSVGMPAADIKLILKAQLGLASRTTEGSLNFCHLGRCYTATVINKFSEVAYGGGVEVQKKLKLGKNGSVVISAHAGLSQGTINTSSKLNARAGQVSFSAKTDYNSFNKGLSVEGNLNNFKPKFSLSQSDITLEQGGGELSLTNVGLGMGYAFGNITPFVEFANTSNDLNDESVNRTTLGVRVSF